MKRFFGLMVFLGCVFMQLHAQKEIQWRGENRTGSYNETGLLKKWPANGPKLLWSYDNLGEGYSQMAIADGKIFITGMKGSGHQGYMSVFSLSGKLLQQKVYATEWVGNYSGPRAAVTYDQGRLYYLSGLGELVCLNAKTLNAVWKKDILKTFGAEILKYGMNEAPLIVGNMVIATPGGKKNNVVALDKNSGKLIWSSAALGEEAAYCSPIYIGDQQVPQIVTITENHIISLQASNGKLLWSYPFPSKWNEQCNSPIYSQGMVLCTTGNGTGSVKLQLTNGGRKVTKLWESAELDNVYSAVVKEGNYVYGFGKGQTWVCLDWKTGKLMHKTRSQQCVPIAADGMLYLYCTNGDVLLVKPQSDKMNVVSKFKITKGTEQHWADPVIYNGVLYIRHGSSLMAYQIK